MIQIIHLAGLHQSHLEAELDRIRLLLKDDSIAVPLLLNDGPEVGPLGLLDQVVVGHEG